MALWEGVEETRLLIAPDLETDGNVAGRLILLRHPKSGISTSYLLTNETLLELHWFKQSYGSWFWGDYICEDGRIYTTTLIDPVFILLPIFEEARMKKGNDSGKFRQLDEILFINGYPGYQHLSSVAESCMEVVCEIKEIGSSKFFRLDESKVLAWLCYKVYQLAKSLPTLDQNFASQDEKNTLADAVSILGEYLKVEPWLMLLCNHLKLNLLEVTRKAPDMEVSPISVECNQQQSSILSQEKKGDKKSTRTGKQSKRAKIDVESQNIKDMFGRALRRRN